MDFLPIFMNIQQRPCLVVGAGAVAARKASLAMAAGAKVTVVAPHLGREMETFFAEGKLRWEQRKFADADIENKALIYACTNDAAINQHISTLAQDHFIPVNVVDNPSLCSFIMPSIIDRSPVQIAISTGGTSPVLARLLRTQLESSIPGEYGKLATFADSYRDAVKKKFPDVEQRRKFWESILEGPIAELVLLAREKEAKEKLEAMLAAVEPDPQYSGEVFLVGAGPGDPDLLSFRAVRLMQQADVVVYDRLVTQPILDLVRRDAERIYAGKEKANHAIPQENINQLLARLAKEGKRVLRLKGGDPFIFGRGGEEIETLIEEGVPFQIVPGITAASGCATYAGIPLTHRDYSQACIMVAGHLKNGSVDLNWEMLAHANQTVVFYMGLHGVDIICKELVAHGRDAKTPAALIEQGTTPQQRVLLGDLTTLPDMVHENNVKAPTLIIVGEVVALHSQLQWFSPEGRVERL